MLAAEWDGQHQGSPCPGTNSLCPWQECSGKDRRQDQCSVISVTSHSNLLVDAVTGNLVGMETAQLTLVPPRSRTIQNRFTGSSRTPGGRRRIRSSLLLVRLHCGSQPCLWKSPDSGFPLMSRATLPYSETSWKAHQEQHQVLGTKSCSLPVFGSLVVSGGWRLFLSPLSPSPHA